MKTGLFFGSFNPIHIGHLCIAQHIINETDIEKIIFILSPQNPFKNNAELSDATFRFQLLKTALADNDTFEASDIELNLPTPSYTSQTLSAIEELGESDEYHIIMGSDTLSNLHKWKNPEHVLSYPILVYPRHIGDGNPFPDRSNIKLLDCPILEISATKIRTMLKDGKSVRYLVKDSILELLMNGKMYQ